MKKKIIISGAAIIILLLIVVKLAANKSVIDENKKIKTGVTTTVTTKNVIKKEQNSLLQMTGITAAKQEVVLKAETAGQVEAIYFNLGDYVTDGKALILIDDKLANLNLQQAEVNLSRAEDEYNRNRNLYEGKAVTETKLRDAKIDYEKAKIGYEQAKKQLSFTKVKSTQNGYITSKLIDKGAYVTPGTPLVSIVDISQLKVTLSVSEKDAYKIKVGQNVNITSSVLPNWSTSGKVSFVSQQGDNVHNYPIEILISNTKTQLKAGTFVDVKFEFTASAPSLLIPRESLVGSIKDAKVYVVKNNVAVLKSIQIGRDLGSNLEVLSGLEDNDVVITSGQINLSENTPVAIINN